MDRLRTNAKVLATLVAAVLALGAAPGRRRRPATRRGQVFFGVSDTGVSSEFAEFSRTGRQASAYDRDIPRLGR